MKFYYSKNSKIEQFSGIHLIQDHVDTQHSEPWNDFYYIVTFDVYHVADHKAVWIGEVKLLVNGYKDSSKYFLEFGSETSNKNITLIDGTLDPDKVVSLATQIDYYKKVYAILKEREAVDFFLSNMCDASFFAVNYDVFSNWDGFSGSLMRDSSKQLAIFKKGHALALDRYQPEKKFSINLESLPETFESVQFNFDSERVLGQTRINLLIGKNGVGKTHILRHMTEIVAGFSDKASRWPYFHKLLVMAYSPFENFYTKPQVLIELNKKYQYSKKQKDKNKKDKRNKRKLLAINEYAYIGFKNEAGVFNFDWPQEHSARALEKILQYDNKNSWWWEGSRLKILFDTLSLSIDFDSIQLISKDEKEIIIEKEADIHPKTIKNRIDYKKGLRFLKNGEVLE